MGDTFMEKHNKYRSFETTTKRAVEPDIKQWQFVRRTWFASVGRVRCNVPAHMMDGGPGCILSPSNSPWTEKNGIGNYTPARRRTIDKCLALLSYYFTSNLWWGWHVRRVDSSVFALQFNRKCRWDARWKKVGGARRRRFNLIVL